MYKVFRIAIDLFYSDALKEAMEIIKHNATKLGAKYKFYIFEHRH